MYGKAYASTFTGSMFGAGANRHAVWFYCISNSDRDGFVELQPGLVAAAIGMTEDEAVEAIEFLCSPDPNSRSSEESGARLLKTGSFQYQLVNHRRYASFRSYGGRREYLRIKKRESRARLKAASAKIGPPKKDTPDPIYEVGIRLGASEELEAPAELRAEEPAATPEPIKGPPYTMEFIAFWDAYPKKVGKGAAWAAWKKAIRPDTTEILAAVEVQKTTEQWLKDKGKYIPNPATWLNQRRWEDEVDTEFPPEDVDPFEVAFAEDKAKNWLHPMWPQYLKAVQEARSLGQVPVNFATWMQMFVGSRPEG
jgi:hypothetical protein